MKLKNTLDEILYDRIVESLVNGEYVMGQNLTLNELAEKYEISRTPVVQAVKQLANDGVLQIMSNGRIYVPEYNREAVRQSCEVRQLIEGYALETFLTGKGLPEADVLPRLLHYADQCAALEDGERRSAFSVADCGFHRALVEAAGNAVLTETYTRVRGRFTVINYLISPIHERDFSGTVASHYQLLDTIREKDLPRARALLQAHISRAARAEED